MFAYHLRIAWKSLKRTPVLSALLVAGIALGIAVATGFVAAHQILSRDPIPQKSSRLYYVQLDAWNPERPWDDERPEEAPDQLTYRDAVALMDGGPAVRRSAMFKANLTYHPHESSGAGAEARPFRAITRLAFSDFFGMFDAPFRYGAPWSAQADAGPEAVIVLSDGLNQRLFGGENSVGKRVRVQDREFTVVGVLAPWQLVPKFYDTLNDAFEEMDEAFVPFRWTQPMEITTAGNTSGWKPTEGDEYADFLDGEATWIQFWAELPDTQQKEAYASFLTAYIQDQKKLGRFGRPLNFKLRDVNEWLEFQEVVPDAARTMVIISLLFLTVCAINLIGILLGKFLARAPEVGVRRALGASRGSVFVQHLLECELVGLLGGLVGVGLSVLVVRFIDGFIGFNPDAPRVLHLDPSLIGAGLLLALAAGFVAGVYPAWRICRVPPAAHLKSQ
jgi:putative ABC transport system permease protein